MFLDNASGKKSRTRFFVPFSDFSGGDEFNKHESQSTTGAKSKPAYP